MWISPPVIPRHSILTPQCKSTAHPHRPHNRHNRCAYHPPYSSASHNLLSKMEIRHVCMALSTIMQFRMCFCCKIRTAIQVDHRFGGYDAKTIPRIHPCLHAPAVNHNMYKALRFPLCPLCALCVCSLLQVCLDSINTLLPAWTVTLVFDTCSFLFWYVSFFCLSFTLYPTVLYAARMLLPATSGNLPVRPLRPTSSPSFQPLQFARYTYPLVTPKIHMI